MGNSSGKPVVFTDEGMSVEMTSARALLLCLVFRRTMRLSVGDPNNSTVNLDHFRLLRVVGKGAFGKVRIVERKDTGLTFALKYIRKDEGLYKQESGRYERSGLTFLSGAVRKRAEYDPRATNARTFEPSIPLQLALQFSGCRVFVCVSSVELRDSF